MSTSIGALKYFVSADISDYTSKMTQLKAARKTAAKDEKAAIDQQIRLLKQQQKDEKAILKQRQQVYNTFANVVRGSIRSFSVGLVGTVAIATKNLADMEKETKNLSATLSQLGSNSQSYLSTLTDLADRVNEVTGINQQLINDTTAIGLQFSVAESDIQNYTKALAALSAKSGKSIQQLAQSLNEMSIKGDFSSLQKLGIYIDSAKSSQEQFNDVLKQGVDYFNELDNQTSGNLTRNLQTLGNVTGEAFEKAGKIINDTVITPATEWIVRYKDDIINASETVTNFIVKNWDQIAIAITSVFLSMNKTVIESLAQIRTGIKASTVAMNGLKAAAISVGVAIKGITRATVILLAIEAAIWAIEKAIDGCVWAWKKITNQVELTEDEQNELNDLLNVNRSLDDQIKQAKQDQLFLTERLKGATKEQAEQAVNNNTIEELTKKLKYEQNEQIREQLQKQINQLNTLNQIKSENDEIRKQLDEQKTIVRDIDDIEEDTTSTIKQQNTELSNQITTLNSLQKTTSNLNKSWNDMLHPTTNINVLYQQYKDVLGKIQKVQQDIYSNQHNALIDDKTRNDRNIKLVTQYNNLLSERNSLTQTLISAKQKEQDVQKRETEAEEQRAQRIKDEQSELNLKRQQLKMQLEIAKAENSGNKDRAEALRIGQEVTKIAQDYKISIEDALKVYKTLNAQKDSDKSGTAREGYDQDGNKLTSVQLRKQKKARENLARLEESQPAAPGEKRKTGVRRIIASKAAIEKWKREAAGDFSGGKKSKKKKSVMQRITAKQIRENIPGVDDVSPVTPSTDTGDDSFGDSTPQDATGGGGDKMLQKISAGIEQLTLSFKEFTMQFAQTFSS